MFISYLIVNKKQTKESSSFLQCCYLLSLCTFHLIHRSPGLYFLMSQSSSTSCCPNFSLRTLLKFLFNWAHFCKCAQILGLYQTLIFPNLSAASETNNHSAFIYIILYTSMTIQPLSGHGYFGQSGYMMETWPVSFYILGTGHWNMEILSEPFRHFNKKVTMLWPEQSTFDLWKKWAVKTYFQKKESWTRGVKSRNKRLQGHGRSRFCVSDYSLGLGLRLQWILSKGWWDTSIGKCLCSSLQRGLNKVLCWPLTLFSDFFHSLFSNFSNQISTSAPSFSSLH